MSGKLMPAGWIATRTWPGPSGAAAKSSRTNFSGGPSSRQTTRFGIRSRSLWPLQRFADQWHPVITEIHIGFVDKDRRRTKSATFDDFVGVGLELILDRLIANPF